MFLFRFCMRILCFLPIKLSISQTNGCLRRLVEVPYVSISEHYLQVDDRDYDVKSSLNLAIYLSCLSPVFK